MTMPHPKGWRIGLPLTPQATPPGWSVGLEFIRGEKPADSTISPAGLDSQKFGAAQAILTAQGILQAGGLDSLFIGGATEIRNSAQGLFASGWGSGNFGVNSVVWNYNQHVNAGGISSVAHGKPSVWLYTRYLKPGGIQAAGYGNAWASHWLRYVTAAGVGDKTARGKPWVSHSPRELAPAGFDAMKVLESHAVGGTRIVAPVGTEMTQWGERIIPEGQTLYPQGFVGEMGMHDVQLHTRYLGAKSFETTPDDLRFPFHYVWNLRQYIRQDYDPNDGLNPQPFGRWTGIENRNKELGAAGWLSERHGYTSIFNNAVVVLPQGIAAPAEEPFYKAGSITHRVRPLQLDGWDSAEQSRWAAVFNIADIVVPSGHDGLQMGTPGLENRSRLYDKVGNFDSMELGTPMVAERVRGLRIEERHTIEPPQIELPEVKLHTRYLEHVSAGDFAGAGMPVLDIRLTVITPRWAFHPPAWIGEPALRNVTPELRTGGANHEEFGTASIRTQWRTVETMYGDMVQWGRPIVRDRRHWVEFVTVGAPPQMMPGPVVTKVGGLPEPMHILPSGIEPTPEIGQQVPRPVLNLLLAYPDGFESLRIGATKVTANSIRVEPGIFEHKIGTHTLSLRNRTLAVKGIDAYAEPGKPRLSPHTIYAVVEAPLQAQLNNPLQARSHLHYVNSDNGNRAAGEVFGRASIGHYNRRVFQKEDREHPNSYMGLGTPVVGNKVQYLEHKGINQLRIGWPSVPGLQHIEFYFSFDGMAVGRPSVGPPPYIGPRPLKPVGLSALAMGASTRVEYFHRAMPVSGWHSLAMGASKPNDTPYTWTGLRVGPLMPTIPNGFNAEQFGQAWVSHRVRDLFVPGEDFMQVAEYDPIDFAKRMRVRNATTPKPPAQGVGPVGFHALQAGTPGVRLGAHHIRPDGNAEQYRKGAP